ncbi:uncharacterized protein LOC134522580 [Chroicocephalus ridibundus]|uniref:uncharacterized protein LOC134522580 n=1 Tax=Chroicocephalus ridibundus TaxID=1192867 RepID=UPI002FDE546F
MHPSPSLVPRNHRRRMQEMESVPPKPRCLQGNVAVALPADCLLGTVHEKEFGSREGGASTLEANSKRSFQTSRTQPVWKRRKRERRWCGSPGATWKPTRRRRRKLETCSIWRLPRAGRGAGSTRSWLCIACTRLKATCWRRRRCCVLGRLGDPSPIPWLIIITQARILGHRWRSNCLKRLFTSIRRIFASYRSRSRLKACLSVLNIITPGRKKPVLAALGLA